MADSNVSEKPILEKIQDLLEQEPGTYDVAFCVGKEKKIAEAVKIILIASSPFLEKEFDEKWEVAEIEKGDGVPLPDFDLNAFERFVKITSLDTWSLESLKALNLSLNLILDLLSICRSFEMKETEENLKILSTIFLQSFGEYKDTDDFLQLSQTNLKYVLGSDDIGIEELDVFYAAMRWAEFQFSRMEVLPSEEQLREVLGDCLFEVRFPIMTCAEFTEARDLKDILTAEETIGVYGFIGSTGNRNRKKLKFDSKMLPFKTTARRTVQASQSDPNSETYNNESLIPQEIPRLDSTRRFESAKNPPIVIDTALHAFNVLKKNRAPLSVLTLVDETQLRPQSSESTSSIPLASTASLSKTIGWGKKIYGFPRRREHAAVAVGNAIYSFGGNENNFSCPSYSRDVLDVFVLNVNKKKKQWQKLSVENSAVNPNQRSGHSAVAHKEFVLIFGGWNAKKQKSSNSTYRFNTQTMKWDEPKVTGKIPLTRRYHSAVVFRNEMLIYGGEGDEVTNDLHSLNLESFHWSTIETKGIPPSLRHGHSATVHDDRFILIFGGWGCDAREDSMHSFDLHNKTWTVVETRGTRRLSRKNHCAFVHNGRMYIFGGINQKNIFLNDVFNYDPATFKWKKVTPNGKALSPRWFAGCVALKDQVFIFGGRDKNKTFDDTFVLQM